MTVHSEADKLRGEEKVSGMVRWQLCCCWLMITSVIARGFSDQRAQKEAEKIAAQEHKIPKLLHYIHLPGYKAFRNKQSTAEEEQHFSLTRHWFDECQDIHKHWDSIFWDEKTGRALIEQQYAWFLPVWDGYDSEVRSLRTFFG